MATVAIKRKNIDLPVDALQKLSLMAVAQGKSLKAYIESILISKAETIDIRISEHPSPSHDPWFDVPENMEAVRKGIVQKNAGEGKTYTIDDVKNILGL